MTASVAQHSTHRKLAVLSDSHDDVAAVDVAVRLLSAEGIRRIVHCGDIVSASVVDRLAGFRVDWVLGNCDLDPSALGVAVRAHRAHVLHGWRATLRLDGLVVGVTHGHLPAEIAALERDGCSWIVHGHSHQVRDELVGGVRFLNPGALHRARPRTLMVVDTHDRTVRWLEVPRG